MAGYDAVGLADLVRRKQVSAHELLDEAIARMMFSARLGDEATLFRLDGQLNRSCHGRTSYRGSAPDRL
jgi:hypothetical protein